VAVVTELTDQQTAERAAEEVFPPPTPVRKRGRPINPDKIDVPHLPKPPSYRPKPAAGFKYWRDTDAKYPNRVLVYGYRRWPITNRDLVGKSRNIDKISVPFPEDFENEILHRYGSGDYRFDLTDSAFNKKVCEISISGLRDPDYPPAIELEELVMDDPANRSYVENLRIKGQLGSANKGEDVAGNEALASVLESNQALTERVLDMATERQAPEAEKHPVNIDVEAASRSMDIIDRAAGMGERIIEKATTKAAEIGGRQQDPLAIVDGLVKIVESMRPKTESTGPDPMLTALLEEAKQLRAQLFEVQKTQMDALRQDLAAARVAGMNPQLQQPLLPGQAPGFQPQMLDGLDKLMNVLDRLKKSFGGGEEELERAREAPTNMWASILPIAIPAFTGVVAMLSNMMYNYAASKMGREPTAPPQVPQGAYTPEQLAELAAGQPVTEQPGQPQPQAPGGADMGNPYTKMLAELKDPLLRALNNPDVEEGSHPGADFAYLLMQWKGRMAYDALRELGKDVIIQLLHTYPPIWTEVVKTPQKFSAFLDEFLAYDQLMAAQDQEEELELGVGEVPPEPEVVVQSPSKPAARAHVKTHKVKTINMDAAPSATESAKPA
jgi:hypothetical protein